jgi:hypothetical protein
MSWNPYKRLKALTDPPPADIGQVVELKTDGVIVRLVSGHDIHARGSATLSSWVYVRDGAIEGPAPALSWSYIEV